MDRESGASEQKVRTRERFVRDGRMDREAMVAELRRFLDLALREMGLDLRYEVSQPAPEAAGADAPQILVNFDGPDAPLLLERQGELLLALEFIAARCLGLDPRLHDLLRFDSGDYRALRLEELKLSARVAAQRVRETHQPFHFNPMSARERRIIHLELTGAPGVRTLSEDVGERRHLVIYPAEKK